MSSYMTVKEAAAVWKCSIRNVQLLCNQGNIPGAQKISCIWVIPLNSIRPGTENETLASNVNPKKLYGRTASVRISNKTGETQSVNSGCTIREYSILNGITLVFQDIHEETINYEKNDTSISFFSCSSVCTIAFTMIFGETFGATFPLNCFHHYDLL